MKLKKTIVAGALVLALSVVAVGVAVTLRALPHGDRGIYYWRTTFALNDYERDFLKSHRIQRLYVRMFDVSGYWGNIRPNATLRFRDSVPDGVEVVPVVYVENPVLYGMDDALVGKILMRVDKMMKSVGAEYDEVQFDCDWTQYTYDEYRKLCHCACVRLHAQGRRFSSTTRLWQTGEMTDSLEADSKVLMLYNLGGLLRESTENSIVTVSSMEPYLHQMSQARQSGYAVALPAFGWGVLFRDCRYEGLLHEVQFDDDSLYEKQGSWREVKRAHVVDGRELLCGDKIRIERSELAEVLGCAMRLPRQYDGARILFHLDSTNLSKYTYDEIEDFYTR